VCRKEGLIAHECKRDATERDRHEGPNLLDARAVRCEFHVHFLPQHNGFVTRRKIDSRYNHLYL